MAARILYMEDDPGQARLLQRRLSRAGYTVDIASNGRAGLDLYAANAYDLLVVDHDMPDVSGLEVLRSLANANDLPPAIMLTGAGNERVAVEVMKMGGSDYVIKDVDGGYLDLIPSVIERTLDQRRLLQEKQRAEAALREYMAELQARNEELDAFAQTVAHDLKSPLTLILGIADMMRTYYDSLGKEEILEYLTTLVQDGRRMDNIINELLVLASVRNLKPQLKPLHVGDIATEAMARLRHMIEAYQAQINLHDLPNWPTAIGHAPWIEAVWVNYISNAIKYGGRPPIIKLGASCENGNKVRFWIHDNGQGLTDQEQAQLFTAFTRLSNLRIEGEGVGLSIVARIISKLEGEVGVESEVGRGSTFYFTLPRAAPSQP